MTTYSTDKRNTRLTAPRVAHDELVVLHGDGWDAQDNDRVLVCGRLGRAGRLRRGLMVRVVVVGMAIGGGLVVVMSTIW